LKTWDEFFERESGLIGSLAVLLREGLALKLAGSDFEGVKQ
jgi:hypothetical protein